MTDRNQKQNFEQISEYAFDLIELPSIVQSIVDFLQPLLLPYESAIYWYMFRHSIIKENGNHIRISTRGLGKPKTVIKSASGQSDGLSYGAVQNALEGLENKKAIKKVGDTNREGTLYQIYLPDQIELCTQRKNEVIIEMLPKVDLRKEADYYNVKENRIMIFERDYSTQLFLCADNEVLAFLSILEG